MRPLRRALLALALLPLLAAPGVAVLAPATTDGGAVRNEHLVATGDGATLYVVEKYDPSKLRSPARAVFFVTATLVDHRQWDSDVPGEPGFNSLDRAVEQGFYAYTWDPEGYGRSSKPANGLDVTAERLLPQLGVVVEWVRARTGAAQVDLVGSSLGSALAAKLGSAGSPIPPEHVGRAVLTANVYKSVQPAATLIIGPGPCTLMANAPQGYMDTAAPMYLPIVFNAVPAAQLWAYQTFPGRYAAGPTREGCDLPVFEAAGGVAPVLVVWGDRDLITPPGDVLQFCNEYGGNCRIRVLPGMGHAPNFEGIREQFWADVFAFLG